MLNASARDILDALENGFRARADLKGKLAELFMSRHLDDFILYLPDGTTRTLEVKNVRSGAGPLRVETQKTRASRSDPRSRNYRVDQFDFIAPCLYNATGRWEYLFARTSGLARLQDNQAYLATMQQIPAEPSGIWHRELVDVLR
jgi:hypothetical protein